MERYRRKMPYWLIVNGVKALLGEIYPEIIAIVSKYSLENKHLLIRYYLNREPIEKEYKSAKKFLYKLKETSNNHIENIDLEFRYAECYQQAEWLDGPIYFQCENLYG